MKNKLYNPIESEYEQIIILRLYYSKPSSILDLIINISANIKNNH